MATKPVFVTIGVSATKGERAAIVRAAKHHGKSGISLSRFILAAALKAAKASMAPRREWNKAKA